MNTPNVIPDKSAELAIAQAEHRFREVFERSPAGVARVGLDGTWLEINDRFRDMLGYTSEELMQMRPWELIHPADLQSNLEERERLLSGKAQQVSLETRYLRKDGGVIWIARTVALVRDASGNPQYFVSVAQDITDRKVAEEKLEAASEFSAEAMNASRIAIFRWDLHSGRWEWDRTQSVVGMVSQEVLGTLEGVLTTVVPEDRAEVFERLNRSVKEGVPFEHEYRVTLPPDGAVAWVYARGSIVHDQAGQPAYLTGAVVNMTEYRALRRQLQDRQELLRLAESAAGVHPWAIDAITARRIWWTPGSYGLYGRQKELGPPTRDEFIQLVHPADREKIREVYNLLNKSGGDDTFSFQFRPALGSNGNKSGGDDNLNSQLRPAPRSDEVRWIYTKGRVQRDPAGWPLRIVGVDIEVTEQRHAREALQRLDKLSVLERLAASVAHEINNPLMALANVIYLITRSADLEEAQGYAHLAQEEVERITHYAGRILRFHRKSSPLHPQKVSEVVGTLLKMLRTRYPNVQVITDFRESNPLESSRDDLEQLLGIVLGNAFEAVAMGGTVKVRIVERGSVNGRSGIRIMVGDTGKGISREIKARLFEPFFSTKDMTGLGLGLWLASRIVQDLGGRLKIFSTDELGTVVSTFLPFPSSVSQAVTSAPAKAA
jgi:PAS domain S-box-containing protein